MSKAEDFNTVKYHSRLSNKVDVELVMYEEYKFMLRINQHGYWNEFKLSDGDVVIVADMFEEALKQ